MAQPGLHVIFDSSDAEIPRPVEIDVVAVHGLNLKNGDNHARRTWTVGDKLWLRDFLPGAISKPPRVMLFEYNSNPATGASAMKLDDHASTLLHWLKLRRKDDLERPLMFICHSLGGLVVKEALVAATLDVSYKSIIEATRLLVFFATPHQGGKYASVGEIMAKLVRATTLIPKNDLLDALRQNSNQATKRFEQSRHLYERCLVINFYEGEPYGKLGIIVDKKSATLNLQGTREKQVAMCASHSKICKFESANNPACELVLGIIDEELKRALALGGNSRARVLSYPLSSIAPVKTLVQRPSLRYSIREQLLRNFDTPRGAEAKVVSIWGMGGAGKSQLALSYMQHHQADYNATFWIQASNKASIDRDFLAIYQLLPDTEPLLSDPSPEDVKQAMLIWFARDSGKYLVIFDEADHLHESDKNYVEVSEYFPRSSSLHIILTSRLSIAKSLSTFEGVRVDELDESQSIDLFLHCAEIPSSRQNARAEAKMIVDEMGRLALAISIAGRYVSQSPRLSSNLPAYLEDFRRRRHDLLSEKPDELVARYDHSVMTVWETSYSIVYEQLPEACRLLTLLSFIHCEDIFLELFGLDVDSETAEAPSWTSILEPRAKVDLDFLEKCFALLEKYSLCRRQASQASYSIHRLVHAWGHDRLEREGVETLGFWRAASQILVNYKETIDDYTHTPASKLRLVPHLTENVQSYKRVAVAVESTELEFLKPLRDIGSFLSKIGRQNEAAVARAEYAEEMQRLLGGENSKTIGAMQDFAVSLRDQGRLGQATEMQEEILERYKLFLGNEHPETITAMHNLAHVLTYQDRLDQAAEMREEALDTCLRVHGIEHPETMLAMQVLALTLHSQGRLNEAEEMERESIWRSQQIFGNEHPFTVAAMGTLAIILMGQGRVDEAAEIQRDAVETLQRIFGIEHPETISAMGHLALTMSAQGRLDEATEILGEVVEKYQRIFGNEHLETIRAMDYLSYLQALQGKPDGTAKMQEALRIDQQTLGYEHPFTKGVSETLLYYLSMREAEQRGISTPQKPGLLVRLSNRIRQLRVFGSASSHR